MLVVLPKPLEEASPRIGPIRSRSDGQSRASGWVARILSAAEPCAGSVVQPGSGGSYVFRVVSVIPMRLNFLIVVHVVGLWSFSAALDGQIPEGPSSSPGPRLIGGTGLKGLLATDGQTLQP